MATVCYGEERSDEAIPLDCYGALRAPRYDNLGLSFNLKRSRVYFKSLSLSGTIRRRPEVDGHHNANRIDRSTCPVRQTSN
jgi:hypothetical protein